MSAARPGVVPDGPVDAAPPGFLPEVARAELLDAGMPAADAARVLAGRLGCSQRQARRYVGQAAARGRVPVPEPGVVFTVRLPGRLVTAVREHARVSGRTISAVVAQALEEFLARGHRNHPRG